MSIFEQNESIPMAFWETLGQYVYGYTNKKGNFVYVGKGNKNRAITHIKDKNYNLDNLVIIAKNLERFREEKQDLQSFILESFLISQYSPRDNSVAGHHQECFIMAKFSELFNTYTKEQHDNFEALPEWYLENYEVFRGRLNVMTTKSHIHLLEFQTREQLQPYLDVNVDETVSLRIAIWGKNQDMRLSQLKQFCDEFGISPDKVLKEGKREFYLIDSDEMTLETALQFLEDFYS